MPANAAGSGARPHKSSHSLNATSIALCQVPGTDHAATARSRSASMARAYNVPGFGVRARQ